MKLNEQDREFVATEIKKLISPIMPDSCDQNDFANSAVLDMVCQDIEETADPKNWHTGDIQIALRRVFMYIVFEYCE